MGVYIDDKSAPELYDRYVGICNGCGREQLKSNMVSLIAKRKYTNPKTIAHLCKSCYVTFLENYEIGE